MSGNDQRAVAMSNRQFGMLRFIGNAHKGTVGLGEAGAFNQVTLGALKRRKFVRETRKRDGVEITQDGVRAVQAYDRAEFLRKVASMHFSSFLNLGNQFQYRGRARRRA